MPRAASSSVSVYSYPSNSKRTVSVSQADLFRLFPDDSTGFTDYSAWLSVAYDEIAAMVAGDEINTKIVVPWYFIIALRQCEMEANDEAAKPLADIKTVIADRPIADQLIAIDLMRRADLPGDALEIETRLHEDGRLTHLRFADLLRDTKAAKGEPAAVSLADELLAKSLDDELLSAAKELASSDSDFSDRLQQTLDQLEAAEAEFKERSAAAEQRKATRATWKKTVVRP